MNDPTSVRTTGDDRLIADRRAPSNSEIMFAVIATRNEVESLKSRQRDAERRLALLEPTLQKLKEGIDNALARINEHMVAEEKDRNLFLQKINAVLLAVLGTVAAAALDLIINYLK